MNCQHKRKGPNSAARRRRKEFWRLASGVQTFCKVQQSTINTICSNAQYMKPAAGGSISKTVNYFQQNSQIDCQHERKWLNYAARSRLKEFWRLASGVSETISKTKACGGPSQAKGILKTFYQVKQLTLNKISMHIMHSVSRFLQQLALGRQCRYKICSKCLLSVIQIIYWGGSKSI